MPAGHDDKLSIMSIDDCLCQSVCVRGKNKYSQSVVLVTSFNIEARYPDIQRSFRRKCTKEFTQTQMEKIKELFAWLKTLKK